MSNGTAGWVAYYRVSTEKQGRSGLGLEAQHASVRSYIQSRGGDVFAELIEVESGRRSDRPQLSEALRLCRIHDATLIIAKLDRLARNVAFVSNLMDSKVEFLAVDFPYANRLTVHILSAVAEHEAELIRDRTRRALTAAKARGIKLGGDRGNLRAVSAAGATASAIIRRDRAKRTAADLRPLLNQFSERGLSYRAIARELDARSIPTARGRPWGVSQAFRLMQMVRACDS